ncbi:MAG: transposase [Ginsengibacter sp.]
MVYLENLEGDRCTISNVTIRLDILFFIVYDTDETLPWNSTLSRTRQLYGEAVFKELFRRVLSLSIDKAIVAGKRQAINIANRDVLPDEIINRL